MLKLNPLREPRANQISTTVFFYSKKIGRQVWCESNLEWDVAIILDHEPFVVDYCEQAIELEWSKSKWVPDYVVLFKNGNEFIIFIIEVKYLRNLLENREIFKLKYTETKKWLKKNAKDLIPTITDFPVKKIELLIITDQIINQSFRVQNLRKLMEASINPKYYIEIKKHVKAILALNPKIKLKKLVEAVNLKSLPDDTTKDDVWTAIYAMIYYFELLVDYEALLTVDSPVFNSDNFEIEYESIDSWFKKYNWAEQENYNIPAIPLVDLYGINKDPKKSLELWEIANERLKIVQPLLEKPIKVLQEMEFQINSEKIHWKTVYNWILAYSKSGGDIRSLIPKFSKRGRRSLQHVISEELWNYGLNQYQQMEKKSIKRAFELMQAYALEQHQLDHCMGYHTFWRIIKKINPKEDTIKRKGNNKAEKLFSLSESEFPHGNYALQSVQIDHTPIDVLVVDEEHRLVTEKPYITVAFDSHTRCVLGYYITYDKPSRLSIAMTLINCVHDKGETLLKVRQQFPNLDPEKLKILETSEWKKVYGLPFTLHMDNGSDFTSKDIRLFGLAYKIHLHYRAVGKAQHGAYVERYLGTLNQRLHSISGTTFSNVQERGDYPSEKKATFTIDELEARVITEIVLYQEEYHSQIRTTPSAKWRHSFSAKNKERGINQNLNLINFKRFKFDILPSERRTVQKSGVAIFDLKYTNPKIEKWIGVKALKDNRKNRRFLIRYDPRDIRTIWFYDEEDKEYVPLHCNNRYIGTFFRDRPITLWDWQAIKNDQIIAGRKEEKLERKLRILSLQCEMDRTAARNTKSIRQKQARRTRREKDRELFLDRLEDESKIIQTKDEINPEVFQIKRPKRVRIIRIPPKTENPFYGITKSKAKEMAGK